MERGTVAEANEGEAPVIVGMAEAAMHMFNAAIDSLPGDTDSEFAQRALVILEGLRKLQGSLTEAANRSRSTPAVIIALSGVRTCYDELTDRAAASPGATLGQRLYSARRRARLSTSETANGADLHAELIESVEAEQHPSDDEAGRIKDLIAALGG